MTNLLLYLIPIIFLTRFLQNGEDEFPIKELNYPNTFQLSIEVNGDGNL